MTPSDQSAEAERPLISNATILILSGFLIGLTVGKIVADELSPYVLACGLSGFLAFIALELTAERRMEMAERTEMVRAHRRLERHLATVVAQNELERYDEEFDANYPAFAQPVDATPIEVG
jgi:hypothetical protein